ncbi:hypothetical protein [Streptomyces sp. NPDC088246]|uniref:hypothetical protein n=1 Tax=Streptomyces sp. NPDC088246 TaxID=3365842 RepID=UPI003805C6A8
MIATVSPSMLTRRRVSARRSAGTGDDGPGETALSGEPDGGSSECSQDRVGVEAGFEVRDAGRPASARPPAGARPLNLCEVTTSPTGKFNCAWRSHGPADAGLLHPRQGFMRRKT